MRGTIEQIWENKTRSGKEYRTVQINGERYNIWDNKYFSHLQEGEDIEYDFRKSGNYRHITDMKLSGGNGPESSYRNPPRQSNNNGGNSGPSSKDRQIARMSCLKSASEILAPVQLDPTAKRDQVIDTARFFERYVFDDDLDTIAQNRHDDRYGGNGWTCWALADIMRS